MIVYKAVRRFGNAYVSAIMDTVGFMLVYDIDHITVAPPNTKLFVFSKWKNAADFARGVLDSCVLMCEVEHVEDGIVTRVPIGFGCETWQISDFWEGRTTLSWDDYWPVAEGTLTCNSVKVIGEAT